jgi:hypothetical protein
LAKKCSCASISLSMTSCLALCDSHSLSMTCREKR